MRRWSTVEAFSRWSPPARICLLMMRLYSSHALPGMPQPYLSLPPVTLPLRPWAVVPPSGWRWGGCRRLGRIRFWRDGRFGWHVNVYLYCLGIGPLAGSIHGSGTEKEYPQILLCSLNGNSDRYGMLPCSTSSHWLVHPELISRSTRRTQVRTPCGQRRPRSGPLRTSTE